VDLTAAFSGREGGVERHIPIQENVMTLAPMTARKQDRTLSAVIVARAALVVSSCALLGIVSAIAQAQTYTQGLPAVGNNNVPSTAAPSKMLLDATLFPDTDMCASIVDACKKLGTAGYPLGATIDARGFTGNRVCLASNITTMLFQCVAAGSSNGATGGKLLLGEVNLYADGPSGGVNGNYSDLLGSGIGTPALIIPYGMWGLYAEEESGADTFLISNFNFVGFDNHGDNAQNFGPISNAEVLTGMNNSNCDYGTTGAYIDEISSDASPSECLDCLRKSCAKTMAS
jgi:hypothetical protein